MFVKALSFPLMRRAPRVKLLAIAAILAAPIASAEGIAKSSTLPSVFGGTQLAQGYGRPPADIGEPGDYPYAGEQADPGQLLVRMSKIENQIRQINGQIEQLQFESQKLTEQLRKFQEDVDFRLREGSPGVPPKYPQKRGGADAPILGEVQPSGRPPAEQKTRGDAFDPAANPNAPGSPRPLGAPAQVQGAASPRAEEEPAFHGQDDPGAPLDLSKGRFRNGEISQAGGNGQPSSSANNTAIAGSAGSAKEKFDIALAFLKQKAYEDAEKGFAEFLQNNPKSKLAPDAIYFLGESYYLRGRQREAAEQYLRLSTQYAQAPRAPEGLLRLGQSLTALGAKEQACATYGEIARKYPNAPAMVKLGAEREAKRAQC
ncbi:MAG TPA: tol-pal system protein YbgF [Methylocella sp.]|nr:tol-pal system protein YbgF [Methylocella sp.]